MNLPANCMHQARATPWRRLISTWSILQVPGVEVSVYRIKDPVHGDDTTKFDPAVLAAPVATHEVLLDAHCLIIGAPGRQGGFAGEVRLFLDSLASFQRSAPEGNTSRLMVLFASISWSLLLYCC
jgi:hypothetical protein